jgi:aryl-alcohol dehydrogenase-like predicted oxidoreductase
MRYNDVPRTSLKVSGLCLGTMMFGGQTSETEGFSIMDYAFEHGITFFDTAEGYNKGESERIVGKWLTGRRDSVVLATKVKGLNRRNLLSSVEASLKRLNTDYIDIYYMHAPDPKTDLEESLETMSGLIRAGKIRYMGISNYPAWQIADMLAICDKRGYIAPIITQNVYNAVTRGIESELVPFIEAHRLGMAVYNPIAGGLLAGKHKRGQPAENTRFANNNNYYERYWSDENFKAVETLTAIAEKNGMTLLRLAMKWCLSHPCVTAVITGVSGKEQIEQNIALADGADLNGEILALCDEVWHSLAGTRFSYIK